ncbi:transcriptional regulator FeaR [Kerstersia gyiorum]|uniref:AraC family transcriptional regulator n=1 Tax=Kerstersia gyiorum TaxID=206506 RepID=A0A4V2F1E2_9BURK|nr:transcriptional regulator FeaR [Kerstersia gyiorum]KAB0544873.1 transcriptional regulator FeaR [Kerstersia gyiorum]MCP1632120.1 AraC-like DNA-binding protein [Kerstersia gyiorum]MCP1635372.1 AraC-like DNA-binding protein [Kerstersia gyiorum]MCP1669700.1 AraC-like DNA-binding protein [Kerstersia gyiorum]MCP1677836.1 AraC-like DNA-binding protein [Kerstersia gyiorum]
MEMLPVAHDLKCWNELLRQACGQFEASLSEDQGIFIGSIQQQDIDGLGLTRIRTNAGRIVCRQMAAAQDSADDSHCFLVVQRQGSSLLRQKGLAMELLPGDMVLMDAVQGCEIVPKGLMEHASVHLDRGKVARLLPEKLNQLCRIGRFSSSSRLARILVEQICAGDIGECAVAGDGAAMQEALLSLLAQSLRQGEGRAASIWPEAAQAEDALLPVAARGRNGGGLLAVARGLIEQSLADPLLSPVRIADRMGVSVRQLYRLFEETGDSVCRYIQRARLQQAAVALRSVLTETRSITDIAFACGFNDAAHFSRAFRKQFGMSPREYRMGAQ